jgi:hypothetical protein
VSKRLRWVSILTALALASCLMAVILEAGSQDVAKAPPGQPAVKASTGETAAAPRPPRERMAVNVLLAWIWVSIAVLFWLIRLRVREADRVYRLGLHGPAVRTPKDTGR